MIVILEQKSEYKVSEEYSMWNTVNKIMVESQKMGKEASLMSLVLPRWIFQVSSAKENHDTVATAWPQISKKRCHIQS